MDFNCNDFETLERICKRTFGPNGVAALIQNSIGCMSITRSGWTIVKSVFIEYEKKSLRLKYFLEDVKKVDQSLGDGVKTFVLLEFYLLKFMNKIQLQNQLTNSRICQELQNLSNRLSEIVVPSEMEFLFENREISVKATSALFYTSCDLKTSSVLQNIFHDWFHLSLSVTSIEGINITLISHLEFLLKNFHLLCFKSNNSRTILDSYILPGFVVGKKALHLSKCEEQVHVVFYIPNGRADILDHSNEINLLINEISSEVEIRIMLITSVILADSLLYDLKLRNIVILQGVSKDDIEVIGHFLSLNIFKTGNNVKVELCIVGSKECTCLVLPNIFQLLISAPTDALAQEYVCLCKRALKNLFAIAKFPFGYGLVKAGGIFERSLCLHIAKNINKANDPWLFNVRSRQDLVLWHNQNPISKVCDVLKNKLIIKHTNPNDQINSIENSTSQSNVNQRNTCYSKCICGTLTKCTESIIFPSFKSINHCILVAFIESLSVVCNFLGNENSSDVVEPVGIRIVLLQHVINSVMVLFKCNENSGT